MKKAMWVCGLILLSIVILSLFVCTVSAEAIIIDTEKGVPGFWTEPARDLPANWLYVHDHPDTSADGWFDIREPPVNSLPISIIIIDTDFTDLHRC